MHEMAIAQSLLDIVREELHRHGAQRLLLVRVCYGAMSNVVPDALRFCFDALVKDTPQADARLELEELPLRLRCSCGTAFTPDDRDLPRCPACGNVRGHAVEQGRELYVRHIEAE